MMTLVRKISECEYNLKYILVFSFSLSDIRQPLHMTQLCSRINMTIPLNK